MDDEIIIFPKSKLKELLTTCVQEGIARHLESINPRTYTIKEAAKELKISVPTFRNYMKDRRIKFQQEKRKIWILEPDLKKFILNEPNFRYAHKKST